MRPVLLEMAGFGSFREPTTVDFAGVEYFALVGPTGSGKSTVIDAMTFALYGSVPRWDNARTVALALAPTVARGTVRFVFDVAGRAGGTERYVVARELRRAASGGVSVRTARLERLRDPAGTGAVEEETEPVAEGAPATTKAVEELLGLPFGDFTTCVVLPQGEFAEFLHTEPRKRQETLVRLLGLGVYDTIAKEANAEARSQEQRAQVLTEQLGGYLDATAEAERVAEERVTALAAVRARVDEAMPVLTAATAELAEVEATVERLSAERSRPHRPGRTARAPRAVRASGRFGGRGGGGPGRAPHRRARRHRGARGARRRSGPRSAGGGTAAPRRAGGHRGGAARGARAAGEGPGIRGDRRGGRRGGPFRRRGGPHSTGGRGGRARGVARRGRQARGGARRFPGGRRSCGARCARRSGWRAPPPRGIGRRTRWPPRSAPTPMRAPPSPPHPTGLRWSRPGAIVARSTTPSPHTAWRTKRWTPRPPRSPPPPPGPRTAAAHVEHARAQRAASVRADLVAALRPNLVVGEECPVCAQAVAVLPERLPEGDLAAADRALAAAEAALDRGRRAEAVATAEHARAAAARTSAADTVERLTAALAGIVPVSTELAPTRPAAPRPDPTIPTTVDASTQSGFADPRPESTSTLSACRQSTRPSPGLPVGRPPESTWRRTPRQASGRSAKWVDRTAPAGVDRRRGGRRAVMTPAWRRTSARSRCRRPR